MAENANGGEASYSFEADTDYKTILSKTEFTQDKLIFAGRLGVEEKSPDESENKHPLAKALDSFTANHHAAVHWYVGKAKQTRYWRIAYLIFSIVLIFLIPIGVFYLTDIIAVGASVIGKTVTVDATAPGTVVAQITALATGVMGVHRAMNAWVEKYFAAANFRTSAASLKAKIYTFERAWAGKNISDPTALEQFEDAVETANADARAFIDKQRDAHLAGTAPPNLDVYKILSAAGSDMKRLMATHKSPALTRAEADENSALKLASEIRTLQAKLDNAVNQIAQLNKELAADPAPTTAREAEVNTSIAGWVTKRNKYQTELSEKHAALDKI